jgi:hypothetical protein
MEIEERDFKGYARGEQAVNELAILTREREKTKRLLIGAAFALFIVAALVIVFAPSDKQNLAYALGAALLVMSLGAIGAAQFSFKLPGVSLHTNGQAASPEVTRREPQVR